MNRLLHIAVGDALNLLVDAHGHAEFLMKLAPETFLEALARLAFAAGEFPQPSEMSASGALRDEKLAGAEDEAGADLKAVSSLEFRVLG